MSKSGHDQIVAADGLPDPPGLLREPSVCDLPSGYIYRVTRYADLILREAFPQRFEDLVTVLDEFRIELHEIIRGGGSRAQHTARFDSLLEQRGWGKNNIEISKQIDGRLIHATRGHEIDMFAAGSDTETYPGIAVEMEWNNKDNSCRCSYSTVTLVVIDSAPQFISI